MTDNKQKKNELSEQTRQLFDAPWKVTEYCSGTVTVRTQKDFICRRTNDEKGRKYINLIVRIPELYDALEQAANEFCEGCLVEHGFIDEEHSYFDLIKNGCILNEKGCKAFPWLKLLQKVRDGK